MGLATLWVLMLQAVAIPPLVGLWDFPGIRNETGNAVAAVDVHVKPSTTATLIARLDGEGIVSADGSKGLCTWVRDLEAAAAPRGCIYSESDYEVPAVAVFDRRGSWLRIALDNGAVRFGWVQAVGSFHPLSELLGADQLTYLTAAWSRRLYDSPRADARGGGRVARISDKSADVTFEQPYRAVGTAFVQGRLWLHVELLDEVCGANEPRVIDTGWVPAHSPAGEQWAWFYSRGC